MPCTAKKFECKRDAQSASGYPDIDVALTTRELGRMIERAGIEFTDLPDEEFDSPLGDSTGAGAIFGATGGVMEAALRTAAETLTGKSCDNLDLRRSPRNQGHKGSHIQHRRHGSPRRRRERPCQRKAAARGRQGRQEAKYHFIEIMACPGGCVNGGGQPTQPASVRNSVDLKKLRAQVLYNEDKDFPLRKSHENPAVKKLYAEYLGKPGSREAHRVLHTQYEARKQYN
jgi:NADP-reducing hydrogenase subunit HndD